MNLEQLKEELAKMSVPTSVRLSECEMITDVQTFIKGHVLMLESHSGNKRFKPYYDRLLRLYKILKDEN